MEGKAFDLARIDEAGGLLGGRVDDGLRVVDGDGFVAGYGEREIEVEGLAGGEGDGAGVVGEAGGIG